MHFYYYRPVTLILSETSKLVTKRIRRQPYNKRNHITSELFTNRNAHKFSVMKEENMNVVDDIDKCKLDESECKTEKADDNGDTVDSSIGKTENKLISDDEKMDFKVSDECNSKFDESIPLKIENNPRNKKQVHSSKLSGVIEKLITKVFEKPMNVTSTQTGLGIQFSSSNRSNELFFPHQHVSPRKRILREFEKVSLEDHRNSTTQKRSRSKSSVSTDFTMVSNSKASGANYSVVVTQHTANIASNKKDENNRVANGTSLKCSNSNDNAISEKTLKTSRTISSNVSSQPVSKPISNYSIISLLGHNEANVDEKTNSENRGSPRSPLSFNHQILSSGRSTTVSKKKSPTNCVNALINSPTNYRTTRSPDINSPSPGLQQNSHHNRYHHQASLSSPTSSFHPYLSSSRASPISSGTLSPTDLYRHRSYRSTASPSSSVSGLTQYTSINGSPTAFANRYSPSTYSGSTKTSPTQSTQAHSLSSAYNVSNLLPQPYDVNTSNVVESPRYSPNTKHRISDWSPARNSATSGRNSPPIYANSLSTTTIPKKTASIRQKYGSLSPNNGFTSGENITATKSDSNVAKKSTGESIQDSKPHTKRSKSPMELHKKPQTQELYEKDLQARYNAEIAAMHHQSLLALHQQASSPFYHMYAGSNLHGNSMPSMSAAAAAAAYMNPLYYHHHPTSELFRKTHPSATMDLLQKNLVPSWIDPYNASIMHYSPVSGSSLMSEKPPLTAKSQNEIHSMLMSPYSLVRRDQHSVTDVDMWNATDIKKSPVAIPTSTATSAFRRQPQQFSDCEPVSLIKKEPSSGMSSIFMILL